MEKKRLTTMASIISLVLILAVLLFTGACAKPSPAPAPAPKPTPAPKPAPAPAPVPKKPFYQGKTIVIVVSFSPGGGTDIYARLIARHLSKHIPGNPNIIVQNMPGAGGGLAFTHVGTRAKPDGLTLAFGSSGVLGRWLTKTKGHDYDLDKMTLLLASPGSTVHYAGNRLGVRDVEGLLQVGRPITSGHTTIESGNAHTERRFADLLGFEVKQVCGYSGYGEANLAVLRGEVEMSVTVAASYATMLVPLVERGDAFVLYQGGLTAKGGHLMRDPRMPKVPTVEEVYQKIRGKSPEGEAWEALKARAAVYSVGPSCWAPPGVPETRIRELFAAFKSMADSPEYKKEAVKVLGAEDLIRVGEEARVAFQLLAETPGIVDFLK